MNIKLTEKHKIKLLNSDDVYSIMQKVLRRENKIDREKEHFWIIGLATNNKIVFIELVSMGGVNSATVEPMNVFRVAVLKGVVKVILVHNHPSGELTPSKNDKDVTDRLIQVGKILAIEVIDHLIISLKSFYSFSDSKLMNQLRLSTLWVPNFELEKRIREEEQLIRHKAVMAAEEKGLKAGEENKAIEMARLMRQDGEPVEKIKKYTQLSTAEIEKL